MKIPRRRFLHLAAGAAALPAMSRFARAQTYPSRRSRTLLRQPHTPLPNAQLKWYYYTTAIGTCRRSRNFNGSIAPSAGTYSRDRLFFGLGHHSHSTIEPTAFDAAGRPFLVQGGTQ
jgi:hypothetical protein